MSLEASMESFVRSVLPQFDPLLKISNSRAPYGSYMLFEVCNCGFSLLFSLEGKTQSIHLWPSMLSLTLLDSCFDLLMIQTLL